MIYVYLQTQAFPYGFMHHLGMFNFITQTDISYIYVGDNDDVVNISIGRHYTSLINLGLTKMVSLFIPFHCLLGLGISEGQKVFQPATKIKSQ